MPMSHRSWKERKSSCIFWMEKIIMKGSMYLFHFISYIFLILQKTFPSSYICLQVSRHDFNCFLQDFSFCHFGLPRPVVHFDAGQVSSGSLKLRTMTILADGGNALVLFKYWEVCRPESSCEAIADEIRVHFRQCAARSWHFRQCSGRKYKIW